MAKKKILITGENSYIGTSFEKWMAKYPDYSVDTISVRGDEWQAKDFSSYDVLFHVAGIAHIKETKDNRQLYFDVNDTLARKIADKAKSEGVTQFIFLSTMSVYGMTTGVITSETKPNPKNAYGQSKLQAEEYIQSIESDSFIVTIVRPPMVYGEGCKGNYRFLEKIALISPIFPDFKNERSVIHIDKLCCKVKKYICGNKEGIYLPQNDEYMSTSLMVKKIADSKGRKIKLFSFCNWGIVLLCHVPGKIGELTRKAFGTLIYK